MGEDFILVWFRTKKRKWKSVQIYHLVCYEGERVDLHDALFILIWGYSKFVRTKDFESTPNPPSDNLTYQNLSQNPLILPLLPPTKRTITVGKLEMLQWSVTAVALFVVCHVINRRLFVSLLVDRCLDLCGVHWLNFVFGKEIAVYNRVSILFYIGHFRYICMHAFVLYHRKHLLLEKIPHEQ